MQPCIGDHTLDQPYCGNDGSDAKDTKDVSYQLQGHQFENMRGKELCSRSWVLSKEGEGCWPHRTTHSVHTGLQRGENYFTSPQNHHIMLRLGLWQTEEEGWIKEMAIKLMLLT